MTAAEPLRLGTRGSPLALRQAEEAAAALRAARPGLETELKVISTSGDRRSEVPLEEIGERGIFIREIEAALIEGEIDIAVHSLKDLPSRLPEGLLLAGVLKREDPRDALLSRDGCGLAGLPVGSRVGTGSLRRSALLRSLQPTFEPVSIRGNVETRLAKMDDGRVDALVMAAAGLRRAGLSRRICEYLPPERFVPSGGQGIIGLQVRAEDRRSREAAASVNHAASFTAAAAERSFLRTLGGDCHTPVGCFAHPGEREGLQIRGFVCDPGGRSPLYRSLTGSGGEAEELGRRCAEELLAAGAEEILEELDHG